MTEVRPLRVRVRAPRIFAFRCLSTFDASSPVWLPGLEPQLVGREGETLLVRFRERALGRLVGGVSRVRLTSPDRITLELLDGCVGALRESIVLESEADTTVLVWAADLDLRLPLVARPLERGLAARLLRDQARATLDRYRVTIEAAALATGLAEPAR